MVEVATGPSDSATHEKVRSRPVAEALPGRRWRAWAGPGDGCLLSPQLPMVLKVPRLNASPLALCDRPFSLLGFGDILVPGTGPRRARVGVPGSVQPGGLAGADGAEQAGSGGPSGSCVTRSGTDVARGRPCGGPLLCAVGSVPSCWLGQHHAPSVVLPPCGRLGHRGDAGSCRRLTHAAAPRRAARGLLPQV